MSAKRTIAFLGPAGSYTEAALEKHYPDAERLSCYSIAEVFDYVAAGAGRLGFVPIENMIQGPVSETLDHLYAARSKIRILTSHTLQIVHCAGRLGSDSVDRVSAVYSHEQALLQCAAWIRSIAPQAERHPLASTRTAAELVAAKNDRDAIVIASRPTLESLGFTILAEDIAEERNNQTRFVLISSQEKPSIVETLATRSDPASVTSIVVDPGRDRQGILFEILKIISIEHQLNLVSIHSRPDRKGGFVFHIDLEGSIAEERVQTCVDALELYCQQETLSTAELLFLGSYSYARFHTLPFRTIGIIGGGGTMGRWFSTFFRAAGLNVASYDPHAPSEDDVPSLEELIQHAEVILLSVPMEVAHEVANVVLAQLQSGQLIVENCSVKACILPYLEAAAPEGVEVLGIHTMFGGGSTSIRGENVLVTRSDRSGEKAQALEDIFYKFGARVTHVTKAEHDRMSAFQQSLVHFALLALGDVLSKEFTGQEPFAATSTPNSRAILSALARVLGQRDELLLGLQQENPEYYLLRHRFLESVTNAIAAMEYGSVEDLQTRIERARVFVDSFLLPKEEEEPIAGRKSGVE